MRAITRTASLAVLVIVGICLTRIALRVTSVQWEAALLGCIAWCLCLGISFSGRARQMVLWVMYPSTRARRHFGLAICVIAPLLICVERLAEARPFHVRIHDEHSYLLQARMLTEGKLWMPAHFAAESFESMHVLVRPVYASIYFPGTALVHVPFVAVDAPPWILPLMVFGASLALLYRIITELVNGLAGLTVVIAALGVPHFRSMAIMVLSQPLMLMLGLLMLFLWLKWRRSPSHTLELCIGLVGGLALITRPIEAVMYAIPIGIAMLLRTRDRSLARSFLMVVCLLIPTVPFLSLQAVHNLGTTGKLTRFASDVFVEANYPAPMIGRDPIDADFKPTSLNPTIVANVQDWVVPSYLDHRSNPVDTWIWRRWPALSYGALPNGIMWFAVVVGTMGICRKQRWVLAATLPLTLSFYYFYTFFLVHYGATLMPSVAVCFASFPSVVSCWLPGRFIQLHVAGIVLVLVTAVLSLSPLFGVADPFAFPTLDRLQKTLERDVQPPALVFSTFGPTVNPHEEIVYNIEAADIDDAAVVRAHDLGDEKNWRLINYYAERQPSRRIYFLDRRTLGLRYLGLAVEVATQRPDP